MIIKQDEATGDYYCEHGTAVDVHCCNCHSGFLFDSDSCHCITTLGKIYNPYTMEWVLPEDFFKFMREKKMSDAPKPTDKSSEDEMADALKEMESPDTDSSDDEEDEDEVTDDSEATAKSDPNEDK